MDSHYHRATGRLGGGRGLEGGQRDANTGKNIHSGWQSLAKGGDVDVGGSDVEKEYIFFLPLVRHHGPPYERAEIIQRRKS